MEGISLVRTGQGHIAMQLMLNNIAEVASPRGRGTHVIGVFNALSGMFFLSGQVKGFENAVLLLVRIEHCSEGGFGFRHDCECTLSIRKIALAEDLTNLFRQCVHPAEEGCAQPFGVLGGGLFHIQPARRLPLGLELVGVHDILDRMPQGGQVADTGGDMGGARKPERTPP